MKVFHENRKGKITNKRLLQVVFANWFLEEKEKSDERFDGLEDI